MLNIVRVIQSVNKYIDIITFHENIKTFKIFFKLSKISIKPNTHIHVMIVKSIGTDKLKTIPVLNNYVKKHT